MGWFGNTLNWIAETFNPNAAVQWYAQHSAANWQSHHFWGECLAVAQDFAGGSIGAWTGSTASPAQAYWAAGWSVPMLFLAPESKAGVLFGTIGKWQAVSGGLCTTTQAWSSGTAPSLSVALPQLVGLGGSLAGEVAKGIPGSARAFQWVGDQLEFNSSAASRMASQYKVLNGASSVASAGTTGWGFGDAIQQSIVQGARNHAAPKVGGILFENCDAVLTDIGEITGGYWDARTQSLVLVGKDGASGRTLRSQLITMDRDHLAVALRASLAAQPMGVSIDPPSEYREGIKRGVNPPDGTSMLVSYLGGTEGTLFGAILFEADRLLKCLDKGVHNESRNRVRATVPGFKPLLEMIHPSDGRPTNVWHRFWFVIDKVELRHDAASDAIAFGDVRLKVLTETEMDGRPKGQYRDPADEAFTRHLTEHYDEYAKDFPILARLKELAKIAALAKFLVNQKIPLDLGALFQSPPRQVDTPSATPGISVTSPNVEVRRGGNVTHTRTVSLFGGVDMDPDPFILSDDGTAKRLKNLAESRRAGRPVRSWEFGENGASATAMAMRLGPLRSPCQRMCDDHQLVRGNGSDLLRLRRVYDSNAARPGDFGPAWLLWMPFSLTVIPDSSRKRPEVLTQQEKKPFAAPVLVLHDHTSGKSSIYRETDRRGPKGRRVFCRVTAQTLSKERSSYQYDPSDEIMAQTGGFLLCRGGRDYSFGASGHLLEIHENGREIVRYCRDNDRLVQIRFDSGRAYDIRYDQAVPARIIEIGISDGCTIRYFYDQLGYLIRCAKGDSDAESYAYDGQGRLAEVYDHAGRVISRNAYNDVGELLRAPSDLVTSPSGGRVLRSFEQNRLMSATDEAGVTLRFQYGGKGEVSAVHVGNRCGRGWRLTYDSTGRLRSLQDPHGRTALLSCDASGRQIEFTGPQGDSRSFHVDEHGRLVAIVEPDGCRWSAEYDSAGRLCSVRGATGEQWDYRYAGQMLLGVRGTAGTVRVRPRRNSLAVRAIASGGAWRESVFDRSGRLTRHQTSGAKPVRLQYSPEGNCFSVRSEAGMVWYVIDESELTVSIAFDDG